MNISQRAAMGAFILLLLVLPPRIVLGQSDGDETSALKLVDGDGAAAGVEVVLSTAGSRRSVGVTNTVGSLDFPASLLTGKLSADLYAIDCETGTTVLVVPDGAGLNPQDRACRDEDETEDSCRCRRLGLFYWPFDTIRLGGGGFPTRAIAIGGGIGAGVLAAVVSSGGEDGARGPDPGSPSSGTGSSPSPPTTPTTPTTPTASGTYPTSFTVIRDMAGHVCCIPMPPNMNLQITVEGNTITIRGVNPFVPVSGPFSPAGLRFARLTARAGTFNATGSGTVAGFSGVRVELRGEISDQGQLTGTYSMGVGGRLPQGEPIVYELRGRKQ